MFICHKNTQMIWQRCNFLTECLFFFQDDMKGSPKSQRKYKEYERKCTSAQ